MSVRRPVRLLDVSELSKAYPLELLADFTTGDFTLVKSDGSTVVHKNVSTMTGASASAAGTGGLVPTPSAGAQSYFLRGDGMWVDVSSVNSSTATTAETADKLSAAVALQIGSTTKNFDGSTGLSWTLSEIGAAASGHNHDTVYSKLGHTHASNEFTVDEAGHAESADEATHAISADEATHATSADSATSATTAGSASKLTTAVALKIGSTSKTFDGSVGLTWTLSEIGAAASDHNHDSVYLKLSGGELTGSITAGKSNLNIGSAAIPFNNVYATTFNGALSGNASTASKLASAVDIGITGLDATAVSFDGSKAVNIDVTGVPAALLTGTISIDRLPAGALERLVTVTNEAARFALTSDQVQTGDSVKQSDTGILYYIVDDTMLDSDAGYIEYTAGTATKATSADTATEATHAISADSATNATNAANATSAGKLASAITLSIGSAAPKSFDGTQNLSWTLTDIGAAAEGHNHDAAYSKLTHNHDTVYAPINHTHASTDFIIAEAEHATNADEATHATSADSATSATTAGSASKLTTAVALKIGSTSKNFDGSAGLTWTLSEIGAAAASHTHSEYVNQNAFSNIIIGTSTVSASAATDSLTLVAGSNVTLSVTGKSITIAATNSTYTAGTGLSLSGTAFSLAASGVSAAAYGPSADPKPSHGGTFTVPYLTIDTYGRVTNAANTTITLPSYSTMGAASATVAGSSGLVPAPAAGKQTSFLRGDGTWAVPTDTTYTANNGITLTGTVFGHSNSITSGSIAGSGSLAFGGTLKVPTITYDAYGHIIEVGTTSYTMPATPTSVSGNAGTATNMATDRTFTIGIATAKSFNDSTSLTWTLADIGAATADHTHTQYALTTHTHDYSAVYAAIDHDHDTVYAAINHTHDYSTVYAPLSHTHNYAGSSSAGGAANSVANSMVIKLNSGTTEGTNMFTFNGSAAKTIDITASAIGAAASSHTHSYLALSGGTLTGTLTSRAITVQSGYTLTVSTAGNVTGISVAYTATIGTTWTGSAAPYYQTITVSGIKATDVPIVDYAPTGTYSTDSEAEEAFMSCIHRVTTAANSITVYVHEKPSTSIPIRLLVIR